MYLWVFPRSTLLCTSCISSKASIAELVLYRLHQLILHASNGNGWIDDQRPLTLLWCQARYYISAVWIMEFSSGSYVYPMSQICSKGRWILLRKTQVGRIFTIRLVSPSSGRRVYSKCPKSVESSDVLMSLRRVRKIHQMQLCDLVRHTTVAHVTLNKTFFLLVVKRCWFVRSDSKCIHQLTIIIYLREQNHPQAQMFAVIYA